MKMHQLATQIGRIACGVFTDTIIFEGKINQSNCNKNVISGIRKTAVTEFTQCMNTTPRGSKFSEECQTPIKFQKIKEFKSDDDTSCFITGELGTIQTYKRKQLQQEILNSVNSGNRF
jgi:hypothetical protein